jgi:hypothetical protein
MKLKEYIVTTVKSKERDAQHVKTYAVNPAHALSNVRWQYQRAVQTMSVPQWVNGATVTPVNRP